MFRSLFMAAAAILASAGAAPSASGAEAPRARDLGIPFDGEPGPLNAITDVAGVEVGQVSLVRERINTGVTAIFPLGRDAVAGVAAGMHVHNGTGEMTGAHLINEIGAFFGPVVTTGTLGVGTARNGVLEWTKKRFDDPTVRVSRLLPVIAETYDGGLSDIWSMPLRPKHVVAALDAAAPGAVEEGAAGGGTGMVCYLFKCGIGTASRMVSYGPGADFTLGVLVQANHGGREELTIAGIPVGREIRDLMPTRGGEQAMRAGDGSIIVIIATDAPLLPGQLERVARRATIGVAKTGAYGGSMSGDIFLAFSVANPQQLGMSSLNSFEALPDDALDPIFEATAQATEEAIINALVAGEDMKGPQGAFVHAMPVDRVVALLRQHGRLAE